MTMKIWISIKNIQLPIRLSLDMWKESDPTRPPWAAGFDLCTTSIICSQDGRVNCSHSFHCKSWEAKYITIDTNSLYYLLGGRAVLGVDIHRFGMNQQMHWQSHFQ